MNDYLVSAIVSTFSGERFIKGCLTGLVSQSLKDRLEIIVIDSCSPENEGEVVRNFQHSHSNIVYLRTETRETLYAAWNRGIKMARGRYVTNANTDDRLHFQAYEVMARELDNHPETGLVYADYLITNLENQTFEDHVRSGFCRRPDFSPAIMMSGCHMGPQPMWRKSIHEDVGYFDESYRSAGDYEFWCRMGLQTSMRHIPRFMGLYYHNAKGIANSNLALSCSEAQKVREKYSRSYPEAPNLVPDEHYCREQLSDDTYVNIGMVTFNRLDFTRQSIESVLSHTDFPYRLTVVDNNSNDGTRDYLRELRSAGIISNLILLDQNIGVAKASNIAWLSEPRCEYYLKLDNDIVIQRKGWLREMVDVVDRASEVGAVAYNLEPESYPLNTQKGLSYRVKSRGNLGGACILFPKRTWLKLGFWCEEYGLYGEEDADYGARIQQAGLINAYMADENACFHLPAGKAAVIDRTTHLAKDGQEEILHEEYRAWKDLQRKRNIDTGIYPRNWAAYQAGAKSLFAVPVHALRYMQKHFPSVVDKIVALRFASNGYYQIGRFRGHLFASKPVQTVVLRWIATNFHFNPMRDLPRGPPDM